MQISVIFSVRGRLHGCRSNYREQRRSSCRELTKHPFVVSMSNHEHHIIHSSFDKLRTNGTDLRLTTYDLRLFYFTCFIIRRRFACCRLVRLGLFFLSLNGLSPVLNSIRIGVPCKFKRLRNALNR